MIEAIEQLRLQSTGWGVELDRAQILLLSEYADLLAGYELANVIGTKHKDEIVREHLLDALSCLTVEDLRQERSLIDVGTGAGLPGIPLSIAQPKLRVTLLESAEKKVRFLKGACAELSLGNLAVLRARAEELGRRPAYRGVFDVATARALATLPVVIEYCAPLVRIGGTILAMKGKLSEAELSHGLTASHRLGLALREVREVDYEAPFPQKQRRIVVLDKVRATPDTFPRRAGIAKKRPLGL
jgi:16S rRNA (guanine527-N7)-methyltransferase